MKFSVVVKIARQSVSFWYQLDNKPLCPLAMNGSEEVPLYFYVSGAEFIFGNLARDYFHRNDPHAYGNYFELIKDPGKHFSIYGNVKPIKQLLYHGVEQCLSYFLNSVLFKNSSIESCRPDFPLRLLFDVDMEEHEKSMTEQLFTEAGYSNLGRIDYISSLLKVLLEKRIFPKEKNVLLLNGLNDVLYLNLHKGHTGDVIITKKLEGYGADPRVRILSEMILEYITMSHSYLCLDQGKELSRLLPFSARLLANNQAILTGDVELSDGNKYWFRVSEKNLNERLLYYNNHPLMTSLIGDLLNAHQLSPENVVIVLASEAINTDYFSSILLRKYPYVKGVSELDRQDVLRLIFTSITQHIHEAGSTPIVRQNPSIPDKLTPSLPLPGKAVLSHPPPLPIKKNKPDSKAGPYIPKLPEIKKNAGKPPLPPTKTKPTP